MTDIIYYIYNDVISVMEFYKYIGVLKEDESGE